MKFILDKFNTELKGSNRIELGLQKFDQQYLHSEFKNGYPAGGRIEYVRFFSLVADFHFTDRLHQLYEPDHRAFGKTCKRNWRKESDGRICARY